jgi:5-methyltetrahydrofolate--homocysteine methyltransferase
LPIWFKPNAGKPELTGEGTTVYNTTPEMMAEQAQLWIKAGASIIGGCCGTSPDHLRSITHAIQK